jgi:hypothetical protein
MIKTSRVLVALGAVTLMTYGSALAQQAPAQPPQAPPSASPAIPPAAPAAPAAAQGGAQAEATASGELLSVDAKANTLNVKTATSEMTFKYDDATKISGATKAAAGLATMTGAQVTVRYKKEGASNMATSIDVKAADAKRP